MSYFNGQGKVYLGLRDAGGNPLALKWVGNTPKFEITLNEDVLEHKESYSGNRLTDVRLTRELTAGVSLTLEDLSADNLNLLLWGASVTQGTSAVTNDAISGATIAVGETYLLDDQDVAALVITDSTGSPKTLTLGTNYETNLKTGQITLLDLATGGPFVGPLKATYTRTGAVKRVKMFGAAAQEYWVRFEGKNIAVAGAPAVMVDVYRARLSPATNFGLITEELAQYELAGSLLADPTKTAASDFGQFGRVVLL